MNVGRAIRNRRQKKGIKQYVLADLAGVLPSTLSAIENKKMSGTIRTVKKIADALDVRLCVLFEEAERYE
jgi:transcriptional regulator with XRE-family HTH domain